MDLNCSIRCNGCPPLWPFGQSISFLNNCSLSSFLARNRLSTCNHGEYNCLHPRAGSSARMRCKASLCLRWRRLTPQQYPAYAAIAAAGCGPSLACICANDNFFLALQGTILAGNCSLVEAQGEAPAIVDVGPVFEGPWFRSHMDYAC